ncbi:MAG: carboxypeptidase regulatory-like domain-containing protein, partial [Actinomycetota bacterium]|nr:carboxypeptidase regulatory-like domain-containing protein [Actinomycetota bacterium]
MTSRGDGTFGFAVDPGDYKLQALPPGSNPEGWVENRVGPFTVTADHTAEAPLGQSVTLRTSTLRGVVRTPAGEPVPRAHVHLYHLGTRDLIFNGADDHGKFAFLVPEGDVRIYLYAPVPTPDYLNTTVQLTVGPPVHVQDIFFVAPNIAGRVLSPDGDPMAGVRVVAYGAVNEGSRYYTTGTDGRYSLRVPAGEWRVVAEPPEENPAQWGKGVATLTIEDPDVPAALDLTLGPSQPPAFNLTDLAAAIDGWTVSSTRHPAVSADGNTVAAVVSVSRGTSGGGDCGECAEAFSHSESGETIVFRNLATGATDHIAGQLPGGYLYAAPALSADGNIAAFWSSSENLDPTDDNFSADVFVHNRTSGVTTRIPIADTSELPDDDRVAMSGDGRTVSFVTERYDENGNEVQDLELVTVGPDGAIASRETLATAVAIGLPSLSADGNTLSWPQYQADSRWTLRVRDLLAGTEDGPRPISPEGDQWGRSDIPPAALDADGSTVAYVAIEHVIVDNGSYKSTYQNGRLRLADRTAGTDEAVVLFGEAGDPMVEGVRAVAISGDGGILTVVSPGAHPEQEYDQAWSFERSTGRVTLVSESASRHPADQSVYSLGASADAQLVALETSARNLVGGDPDDYGTKVIVAKVAEKEPPAWPAGAALTAGPNDVGSSSVRLHWTAATDNVGVSGYRLYQDGAFIRQVPASAQEAQVEDLAADTAYRFQVQAVDAAGNESADGPSLDVRTFPSDTTELRPLSATTAAGGKVLVQWEPAPAGTVTG